jgi:multiple sugar transport system substrate-binding protein
MTTKKWLAVFLICLLSITLATGSALAKTKIKVTYWGGAVKKADFEELTAQFMEENPDIEVELINVPGDYVAKILTMISGGDIPDVMNTNDPLRAKLSSRGLLDLTGYMQNSPYRFLDSDVMFPEFRDMLSDGDYQPGDPLLGVGLGVGTHLLSYNKALFDEAGVPYPEDSWTWTEDILAAAHKLTRDTNGDGKPDIFGISGLDYGGIEAVLGSFVQAFGGEVYDFGNDKVLVDSPQAIAGLQFAQDLIYKHKVAPTPSETQSLLGGGLASGKVGMYIMPTFEIPSTVKSMTDPWALANMPVGPARRATTFYGGALSISRLTKNVDAAWRYIEFMAGPPGIEVLCNRTGFNAPAMHNYAMAGEFIKFPGAPEGHIKRLEALEQYAFSNILIHPRKGEILQAWTELQDQFWLGKISGEEFAKQAKRSVEPLMAR